MITSFYPNRLIIPTTNFLMAKKKLSRKFHLPQSVLYLGLSDNLLSF